MKKSSIITRIAIILALFSLMVLAGYNLNGHIMGHDVSGDASSAPPSEQYSADTVIINTTAPGKDIEGFAGPVPLEIYVYGDRIVTVRALPNNETPSYFEHASTILSAWNQLKLDSALSRHVDAVSGATYSSRAIIDNVHTGVSSYMATHQASVPAATQKAQNKNATADTPLTAAMIAAIITVAAAAILPMRVHSRRYRIIQQLLNVSVLGFWAGTMLSYTLLLRMISVGLVMSAAIVPLMMLVTAVIYPLAGHPGHYCNWICPYGSLQELAGHIVKFKLHITHRTARALSIARTILWVVLMLLMVANVWMGWLGYEIFTAFAVNTAPTIILVVAAVFVALSAITPRPFCRWICPMGSLLHRIDNPRHL